ncbi:hypothetical protein MYP_2724 [Sporocytophaga myxococcoides]|uniref:DUF4856 domain-containing protein n=1 Tax=Sporocytophaga myxococcoides TaxID=153721 RepID=A0A098LEY1_9BACT|nr:DUF4856 domain-containing protein [Sporocytophaga myxococcoides]GAL85495.1 hypothetical protein MYP_2724 [Sporocytophaga myxococcoides]
MKTKLPLAFLALSLAITACKKDKDDPTPAEPGFRTTKVDYNALTATTSYNSPLFFDNNGDSTVDRTEGRVRLRMLKAIDAYGKSAASETKAISATALAGMFENTNNSFVAPYTDLNSSNLQLKSVTASSFSQADQESVHEDIIMAFNSIAEASESAAETAEEGKAGKLGTYLVDEYGIEWIQVISKSLIGGFQLDYIGNVLLSKGLDANNTELVAGKKYTQLEHNWDEAYGLLTVNDIYAATATDATKDPNESFLGSYVWEYNKEGYKKLHAAFLKGRAAIINNDKAVLKAQADLIRAEFEKAIASAALGYLGKWKPGATTTAANAHAIGEGVGFIYSLRFCKINGADAKFSDDILDNLLEGGFWGLYNDKVNAASDAIKAKFNL